MLSLSVSQEPEHPAHMCYMATRQSPQWDPEQALQPGGQFSGGGMPCSLDEFWAAGTLD